MSVTPIFLPIHHAVTDSAVTMMQDGDSKQRKAFCGPENGSGYFFRDLAGNFFEM